MTSADLGQSGFGGWTRFNTRSKANRLAALPAEKGVYCIRCRESAFTFPVGHSDILYIGSAANLNGLRGRCRQYLHPGPSQRTNQRILARCGESEDYEIGYVVTLSGDAAVAWERTLLNAFWRDHRSLPPENIKRPSLPDNVPRGDESASSDAVLICRTCNRAVRLTTSTRAALRAAADAGWAEPIEAVFTRGGHRLRCSCGAYTASLSLLSPSVVPAIAPRRRVTGDDPARRVTSDADTYYSDERSPLSDQGSSGNTESNWLDPDETDEQDDYSFDEYAIYDPDRDEWIGPDDEASDDPSDYDDSPDDEDDYS